MGKKVMYWDRGVGTWIVSTQEEVDRLYAEPGNISVGEVIPLGTMGELTKKHARAILAEETGEANGS